MSERALPPHVAKAIARAQAADVAASLRRKRPTLAPTPASTLASEIRLRLPSPPSANRYWRSDRGGRPHLSKEAKDYCARVKVLAFEQGARDPMEGPIAVSIVWTRERRSGDLDGRLKIVLDALQGSAYVNDAQIVQLDAKRQDRDVCEPGLEIVVRAA